MRWTGRLAALVLATAVSTGCGSSLHDATHPEFLSGKDASAWIDREVGDLLAGRHPGVTVLPSKCPFLMNLTGPSRGHCSLLVNGNELHVDVEHNPGHYYYELRDVDTLVVKHDAERTIADGLTAQYGTPFTAHCDGPTVRMIARGDHITCGIDAPAAPDIVTTRVDANVYGYDQVFAPRLPSGDTALERLLGRDVAETREGGVAFAGARMERYLHATAGSALHEELRRRGLLGAVRCPARITLHGWAGTTRPNTASCTAQIGGKTVRYTMRFDGGSGFSVDMGDRNVILIVADLRQTAQRAFEHRLGAQGKPFAVRVECGKDAVVLVEIGAGVPCTATWTGDSQTFEALVSDTYGNYKLEDTDD